MDRTEQMLTELDSRAQVQTLEDIKNRGKSSVKVIRPSEIAGLITQAVEKTVAANGYVPPEEVERLVDESRSEFKELVNGREIDKQARDELAAELEKTEAILSERQKEFTHLQDQLQQMQENTEEQKSNLEESLVQLDEQNEELDQLRNDLTEAQGKLTSLTTELEESQANLNERQEQVDQLQGELAQVQADANAEGPGGAPAGDGGVGAEVLMRLMSEITELKSQVATGAQAAPAATDSSDQTAAMLEKIVGGLDKKLEKLGKKVGITDAVEADAVMLDDIFKAANDDNMESNVDNIKIKESKGAGIGANLARLRKLKQ